MEIESKDFNRFEKNWLKEKIKQNQSFLLFGPRQTGKTTLLASVFDEISDGEKLVYNFHLPETRSRLTAEPEVLVREVEAKGKKKVFVWIDEIQKIPEVMDVLQYLIDQKKIVLCGCGSSARKLRQMDANWLPGRVHVEYLYPMIWEEISESSAEVDLKEYLVMGGLPGVLVEKDKVVRKQSLDAYAQLYLEEEIRAEAVTRSLPRFTKFLRLAAMESGTSPNLSKIARQVGTTHTTIRQYFEILKDTLIVHEIPAFGGKRDSVLKSSRYYFFDTGVRNATALLPLEERTLSLQMGVLFEHMVILNVLAKYRRKFQFAYYRTKSGEEVDLILENGLKRVAIEIKATKNPQEVDFKNLSSFGKKYDCDEKLLFCQVERAQKFEVGLALPWQMLNEQLKNYI